MAQMADVAQLYQLIIADQHSEQSHQALQVLRNRFQGSLNLGNEFGGLNPTCFATMQGCPTCVNILLGVPPFRYLIASTSAYQIRKRFNRDASKCYSMQVNEESSVTISHLSKTM
jgi:hypothetical protein